MLKTLIPVLYRTFALLLLISICQVIGSKNSKAKLNKEDLHSIQLPPCAACKVLIESFKRVSYFVYNVLIRMRTVTKMTFSNQKLPRLDVISTLISNGFHCLTLSAFYILSYFLNNLRQCFFVVSPNSMHFID